MSEKPTPADEFTELRRHVGQLFAEIHRGTAILEAELKAGQFTGAMDSAKAIRSLAKLGDKTTARLHRAAHKMREDAQ